MEEFQNDLINDKIKFIKITNFLIFKIKFSYQSYNSDDYIFRTFPLFLSHQNLPRRRIQGSKYFRTPIHHDIYYNKPG